MLWKLTYNIFGVPAMLLGSHAARCCNPKVQAGIKGRRQAFPELHNQLQTARPLEKTAWFHFTSVGEFEQVKPLIEAIYAETRIVLTFFSPSVAQNAQAYVYADAAVYLPLDTHRNADRLIRLIQPTLILFSRYDMWPNLVWRATRYEIPIIVVAATLHAGSKRLARIAKPFFRSVHRHITLHCAISTADADRLKALCTPHDQIVATGDTRYEQVHRRALTVEPDTKFFPGQATLKRAVLIAGSTYAEDEKVLLEAYRLLQKKTPLPAPHLILVPHEPTPKRIKDIRAKLSQRDVSFRCLSELRPSADLAQLDILVIDNVGLLAKLYAVADIAFVGGSFRGSVHNVMEPAAMATPVVFGPTIQNAHEASLLLARGGAKRVHTAQQMAAAIAAWLNNPKARITAGNNGRQLITENLGAVARTLVHIRKYL